MKHEIIPAARTPGGAEGDAAGELALDDSPIHDRTGAQDRRKTQIVVVGGGAGGLELVRRLGAKYGRKHHDIILVDRNLSHIWKPLLHEVAAGSLDANLDEVGYRGHCARWGYRFFQGTLAGIDRDAKTIELAPIHDDDGEEIIAGHAIRYDLLVLALGSVSNDFGVSGVKEHCLYLDSRKQADRFRTRLLNHCLRVSRAMLTDPAADERVRIAIVGGGATGVELAAELYNAAAALAHYGLEVFDETRLDVTLLEAGPRILPALPEDLSRAARRELEALGVSVREDTQVIEARRGALVTQTGAQVRADLMVWAAGVKGAEFLSGLELETNPRNQIVVTDTLQSVDRSRYLRAGRLRVLHPFGRGDRDPAARAGRAPDGRDRVRQHPAQAEGQTARRLRLRGQGIARLAQPLFDRGQPDGEPGRRQPGGGGAHGAVHLHHALSPPPAGHSRHVEGAGADDAGPRQPHSQAQAQAALINRTKNPPLPLRR